MDLQQLLDALNHQTRKVNELRAENERLRAIIVNAQDVIEEVQLIDNTPDDARRVRREMRAALDAAGGAK
jgi:hypothetical protein